MVYLIVCLVKNNVHLHTVKYIILTDKMYIYKSKLDGQKPFY